MAAPSARPATVPAARRWLAAVLGTTLALLGACATFVWWVDPFQQYRLASRYPPRFYALHHRYINPGLAKNQHYDTVLIGSSTSENTRNDTIERFCGGSAVNLSMPAMSASEQRLMVDTAFANRPLRRAILVLDFNEFSGGLEERQDVAGPLPRYLYDRNPFNDLPYLLSGNLLLRSWRIVAADRSERFTSDPGVPWYWGDRKRFGRGEVLRELDLAHLNAQFGQPRRTLSGMRASFEHNLLPLFARHPDTRFDLIWPPYSILVWLDFAQRGQLEVSLEFKRYVFAATRGLPNVGITDLQSEASITHDLDRYTDIYHFDPAINERVIEAACTGPGLDAGRLEQSERRLREQVAALATPEGLARVVGTAPSRGGKATVTPALPPAPRK